MRLIWAALPAILLASISQLTIRWRVTALVSATAQSVGVPARALGYLTDPYILGAYVFSLLSSIAWFFVLEKYPVTVASPFYVGFLFTANTLGSAFWLREGVSVQHVAGMLLILAGVIVVSRAG